MSSADPAAARERATGVRLAVFDVDGVLTDGRLIFDNDGGEYKAFSVRDGLGMKLLRRTGIEVAIITARSSRIVTDRMASLGVELVLQGRENKLDAFRELLGSVGLNAVQTAYVGDDVMDLPVMAEVGFAAAVADAHPLVRERAHWCTESAGGEGAAREVCEFILRAQGKLEGALAPYTRG